MRVTKFERTEDGAYTANVSINGTTIPVTNKFGAWGTVPAQDGRWREVLPRVAEALQAKLPRSERGRR